MELNLVRGTSQRRTNGLVAIGRFVRRVNNLTLSSSAAGSPYRISTSNKVTSVWETKSKLVSSPLH